MSWNVGQWARLIGFVLLSSKGSRMQPLVALSGEVVPAAIFSRLPKRESVDLCNTKSTH